MEERQIIAEVKRVAEEKAVVEARRVEEEQRKVELEEQWRLMVEEAEGRRVMEEELVVVAAARHGAVLAAAETAAKEAGTEQDGGLPSKQKGQAEGEWLACDRCMTRGFDCQVSWCCYSLSEHLYAITAMTSLVLKGWKLAGVHIC